MTSSSNYYVTTFYKFMKLADVPAVQKDLENKAEELNVKGLVILGTEGFNSTCAASSVESFEAWKQFIREYFSAPELFFKDSVSPKAPFRRFKAKIREEIVTTGIPEMMPPEGINHHLTPTEWNKVLKEEKDFVMIDTRNWYEYKIGTFKGALNPNIEKFTDFPQYIESQGISKDKKMLIFCTGGIRCEKGILELQKQGYDNVYQLEGGILNYMKEYPRDQFEGECFVFDHRVALDADLQPSQKYGLCPHCGQPSEIKIECKRCDSEELICVDCAKLEHKQDTCSKNCAHQWKLHPGRKGPKQIVPFEIEKLARDGSEVPTIRVSKTKVVTVNSKGESETVSVKK
ncbi:rhodanese-related sulfurtransferase [Bdellovibrio sp. HCB2-146]|uniref:oxygen-dependent tRNA uridine(34) hydroxylase TrhO n=1 Tax=Bdellovibrio sp. HCB2-146 TaxID=3394362 RepID=UPI0039BC5836